MSHPPTLAYRIRRWAFLALFAFGERHPNDLGLCAGSLAFLVAPVDWPARAHLIGWAWHVRRLPPHQALAEIAEARRQWHAYQATRTDEQQGEESVR